MSRLAAVSALDYHDANSQRACVMVDRDIRELLIGWTAILTFALAIVYFSQ
jgi:hypothetical protein